MSEQLSGVLVARHQYDQAVGNTRTAIKSYFDSNLTMVLTQDSVEGHVSPQGVHDMNWGDEVWNDIVKADKDGIYTENNYVKRWDSLSDHDFMNAARWVYNVLQCLYFGPDEEQPEQED